MTAGIIGFGRFGSVLAGLLQKQQISVSCFDSEDRSKEAETSGVEWTSLAQVMKADVVFLAVPIRNFPDLLKTISSQTKTGQVIIDVASVKTQVRDWMLEFLPEDVQVLNTHPMFGPDSIGSDHDLKMVYCPTRLEEAADQYWRGVFESWGCRIVELSCEEHDRLAARSQGLTHFMGRVMEDMGVERTIVDTHGFRQVHHVVEQTCEDTVELFRDLQNYNPNTPEMLRTLRESLDKVEGTLFRRQRHELRVGYQGVPGSFSDEASGLLCDEFGMNSEIRKPCISSDGVLTGLNHYNIDVGVVAMENAQGGVVHESIHALAMGRCRIATMFHLQVRQCLLVRPGVRIEDIREIHSHLQALKQCNRYLSKNFTGLPQREAEDTALAARLLSESILPEHAAVIAPARSAELYGLEVLAKDIQDLEDNKTLFLALIRPGSGIQLQSNPDQPQV